MRPAQRLRVQAERLSPRTWRLVLAGPLLGLLTLACQERTSNAEESADMTADASSETGTAVVDTPPAAGAPDTPIAAAGDTGAATAGDTGAAAPAGQEARPTGGQEPGQEAGDAAGGQGAGDLVNGWKQYEANCARCHGQDALGSALAPDLRGSVTGRLDHAAFVQVVMEGRPQKGMPAFSAQLDAQKVEDIHAYVTARGSGKLGPGRPGG